MGLTFAATVLFDIRLEVGETLGGPQRLEPFRAGRGIVFENVFDEGFEHVGVVMELLVRRSRNSVVAETVCEGDRAEDLVRLEVAHRDLHFGCK